MFPCDLAVSQDTSVTNGQTTDRQTAAARQNALKPTSYLQESRLVGRTS